MADTPSALAICSAFDLGTPVREPVAVVGGLSHRMWRLETTRGRFAVKQINRDFDNPGYVDWYERAFRAEMTAYHAGVPMPRPVAVPETGACLAELPDSGPRPTTVRVHDWVDATPIANGDYGANVPHRIGEILARVHALRIEPDGVVGEVWRIFGPRHWLGLAERAEAAGAEWARALDDGLSLVAEMEAFVDASRPSLGPMIMSHRDVDQKNVLVAADGGLLIVDWDATGPVSARHELANTTLVWGGGYFGEPRAELSRAVIEGYRATGGEFDDPRPPDFAEFVCIMVNWFEFNVRRALGERLQDESDRALAEREVRHILRQLDRVARSPRSWATMLG